MRIVVGLGNPGAQYEATRHNVGVRVVEAAAAAQGAGYAVRPEGRLARIAGRGEEVWYFLPGWYMNRSGEALGEWLDSLPEPLEPAKLLVVTDDINLPLGRLRLRGGGSCGGHNGLASIELALGTREYPRLRVGVGAPDGTGRLVEHVLGEFPPAELKLLEAVIPAAAAVVRDWLESDLAACQGRCNGWMPPAAEPAGADEINREESARKNGGAGRAETL